MNNCQMLNVDALASTSVQPAPFPYLVLKDFIHKEHLANIVNDYPKIENAGSFPLHSVKYGKIFEQLVNELTGDALRQTIAEKFAIDLTDKPVLLTVRGRADHKDGRIHTDSKSKLITLLLYMNDSWQRDEGCLRLLYDDKNLDNYAAEIQPSAGTALFFKVTENGWHGHKPVVAERKVIQLNYISDSSALAKHQFRHRLSAKIKQWARAVGYSEY